MWNKWLYRGIFISFIAGIWNTPSLMAQGKEARKRQEKSISYMRRAERAKKENDFARAEADYRVAMAKNPKNAKASYNFGALYNTSKKTVESMRHLLHTAKNAKQKSLKHKAFHNLGNAFMEQKDYAQAVKAYEDALRNDPADDQTRYNLAVAKRKLKKKQAHSKKKNKKNKDKKKKQGKNKNQNKSKPDEKKNKDRQKKKSKQQQKKQQQKQQKKQQQKKQQKSQQKKQKKQQPRKGEISKKRAESLLRAAQNLEKKVQKKRKKEKAEKAPKNPNQKDW